jgi:cell division GTPase FtsZ
MDRRKFLEALSVLSTSSAFAGAPSPITLSNAATPLAGSETFENDNIDRTPRIGVIAVGSAGGEMLTNLYGKLPHLSHSIAIDTNPGALHSVTADQKILVAGQESDWLGNTPARMTLPSDVQIQLADAVADLDIAFLVAEMDGVAGTFVAPAVAEVLRERPVIAIGAAVTPFIFENQQRQRIALAGTHALSRIMNVVFPIPNELLAQSEHHEGLLSFSSTAMFERLYRSAVLPIAEPGLINFDAETIRLITSKNGYAAMGYGSACGADADVTAARQAIAHPLLGKRRLRSASGILFSVEGSPVLTKLGAVCRIVKSIRNTIGEVDHEQIIFCGAIRNETLTNEFRVTILAGGILAEENV